MIRQMASDEVNEEKDVVRRGDGQGSGTPPQDDPFYDPFDEITRVGNKRGNDGPSTSEPQPKQTITEEQRKRIEENKAKALARKAQREKEQRLAAEQKEAEINSQGSLTDKTAACEITHTVAEETGN